MKLFVWDLHGTLEEGNDKAVLFMNNTILKQFGYKKRFTQKQCNELSGKKWFEYFEFLLPDESHSKHMELQNACIHLSNSKPEILENHIMLTKHALDVLEEIHQHHDQVLLSNSKFESLVLYGRILKISHIFPKKKLLATNAHLKFISKHSVLSTYLINKSFDQIVAIGDSPADIELGHALNGITFLYSHPGKTFRPCNPHYKINDLREVLKVV